MVELRNSCVSVPRRLRNPAQACRADGKTVITL
jgi:hypothetical protein